MEQKVKCPHCGQDTPAGKKFCGHCGARLVVQLPPKVCSSCGAENQPDQQFCSSCGAKLAAPVAAAAPSAPGAEPKAVAKPGQVTVKPTWGLAWGLWWRMMLLSLLLGVMVYLIAMVATAALFGWAWKLPFGP